MSDPAAQITRFLHRMRDGDADAAAAILPLVYEELRNIAGKLMRGGAAHTLQPTALVHEAWLKIARSGQVPEFADRRHFLAVAARAMRQVLLNHARDRRAQKRGGDRAPLPLDDCLEVIEREAGDMVALNDVLELLAGRSQRSAQIVELRVFTGLTIEETAEVVGASEAAVKAEWRFARAFLQQRLGGDRAG
ncbi:MAG: sigma-70 family RNA polymerase sigma factor [Planctomycetes bacterium]|nr:sigma-70 family RNA polymerase sigma factor [Planctomycetota bacterium]